VEDGAQTGTLSMMFLAAIALLIPIIGFIMMLSHAKAGETRQEQRWRKSHGLVYWVLLPGIAGILLLLGYAGMLPDLFSIVGVIILSLSAMLSYLMQKRHESQTARRGF
jgi:DMSO/TMAO reductase YedYZ heme-binding membrane subunit